MNNPILFSILVAQYNNGKYFNDYYNSIMAQTYKNWKVIIVDDCSTDASLEQINKLIGNDSRFKILLKEKSIRKSIRYLTISIIGNIKIIFRNIFYKRR